MADKIANALELRRRDFKRFIAQTFPGFVDGWVYDDVCKHLRQFMLDVRARKSPRLILCLPPRLGKSELTSIRFAIFCLLNNPSWEVIVGSYGQSMANRFSRRARSLVEAHPYIKLLWPKARVDQEHGAVEEWRIAWEDREPFMSGGTYRAVGRGSSITGAGADCLLIDDPIKDAQEADSKNIRDGLWEWYTTTARTRLAPGGGIVVIQTRWHVDDLAGKLEREARSNPKADQWNVISYEALASKDEAHRKEGESIHPERWPKEELEATREVMAPRWWAALYRQSPTLIGGNLFKDKSFKRYVSAPPLNEFDMIIQVWDLRFGKSQAKTASWVVGDVWGKKGGCFYLLDEVRDKWSFGESKTALEDLTAKWPMATAKVVENKANGPALEDDLCQKISGIILYNPRGDKIQRAERVFPLVAAGNVYIPDETICTWARDWVSELCEFPRGSDDDRVDTLSMALGWFVDRENELQECIGL